MTIPMLAGVDDVSGEGLAKIADALQGILQPYKKHELELKNAIAKNPKIAEQLADLEYSNPGSTGKIFGPNVQQYAASLAPSIPAKIQRQVRDGGALDAALSDPANQQYLAQGVLGFQRSEVKKEKETIGRLEAMEGMLSQHPELREDRAFQDVLGKTRAQHANEQAELAATQGAEAFLGEGGKGFGKSPLEILDAVLGENPNMKLTPREVGDLFQSPTYGALFKTLMTERLADRREEMRLKIAKAQTSAGLGEDLIKLKVGRALARATEIENANPAAVAAVLYGADDPSVVALGGVTNAKDPNYARFQNQITEAKTASDREGAARDVKRVRDAQANVVAQQKILQKLIESGADDSEIAIQTSSLNTALDEAGKITGRTVVASYVLDPERFFAGTPLDKIRNRGVHYFDHNGKPITEASVPTYIGEGKGEYVKPPEQKKPDSNAIGNPASGDVGKGEGTSTRTSESASVTVKARDIFPNMRDEAKLTQLDRIGTIQSKQERQSLFDQFMKANPNLTEDQKKQVRTLFKVD